MGTEGVKISQKRFRRFKERKERRYREIMPGV